jgi:hypothetical protein
MNHATVTKLTESDSSTPLTAYRPGDDDYLRAREEPDTRFCIIKSVDDVDRFVDIVKSHILGSHDFTGVKFETTSTSGGVKEWGLTLLQDVARGFRKLPADRRTARYVDLPVDDVKGMAKPFSTRRFKGNITFKGKGRLLGKA